jgi:hypothetical protein
MSKNGHIFLRIPLMSYSVSVSVNVSVKKLVLLCLFLEPVSELLVEAETGISAYKKTKRGKSDN